MCKIQTESSVSCLHRNCRADNALLADWARRRLPVRQFWLPGAYFSYRFGLIYLLILLLCTLLFLPQNCFNHLIGKQTKKWHCFLSLCPIFVLQDWKNLAVFNLLILPNILSLNKPKWLLLLHPSTRSTNLSHKLLFIYLSNWLNLARQYHM
jgi:hypothetical protein